MLLPQWTYMLSFVSVGFAQSPPPGNGGIDISWYPSKPSEINNLTAVMAAEGVYGFTYNSSHVPDEIYGVYNWCNMPHVRKREYVRAPDEYELVYVEVIQRHHKRTPYASNGFPVEPYPWDCDDQGLYFYGEPFGGPHRATPTYWKGYTSETNPFTPSGWTGTCQFPQITASGLEDSWQHGADLYDVYHGLLGLLPSRDDPAWRRKVVYRVTHNPITSQVAGMLIHGMWRTAGSPPGSPPVPLLVQPAHDGSVSRLLAVLQVEEMVWPGMGSEVVFDLYRRKRGPGSARGRGGRGSGRGRGGYFVRVLFGGKVLRSSSPALGVVDMIPAERLLGYFDGLVGKEAELVVGRCNGSVTT